MADHLIQGEDFEVLPNGTVDLNEGALQKLWDMGVTPPTEAEADAELAMLVAMLGLKPEDLV